MKSYLLAAVGVIFLTVTVSFIVPEGKLKKSVNFILRLVSIFVIIQPITGLFDFKQPEITATYNYEYVCQVYSQNQSRLVAQKLEEELGLDCVCLVDVIYDDGKIKENGVTVVGEFVDGKTVEKITEYLRSLGYINITVNEKTA